MKLASSQRSWNPFSDWVRLKNNQATRSGISEFQWKLRNQEVQEVTWQWLWWYITVGELRWQGRCVCHSRAASLSALCHSHCLFVCMKVRHKNSTLGSRVVRFLPKKKKSFWGLCREYNRAEVNGCYNPCRLRVFHPSQVRDLKLHVDILHPVLMEA